MWREKKNSCQGGMQCANFSKMLEENIQVLFLGYQNNPTALCSFLHIVMLKLRLCRLFLKMKYFTLIEWELFFF